MNCLPGLLTTTKGLFGLFSDSLPDGWGRLLLDRTLTTKGILLQDITPLQRLSYVGLKGMGALIYRPQIETSFQETLQIELDAIAKEMLSLYRNEGIRNAFIAKGFERTAHFNWDRTAAAVYETLKAAAQ